MATGHSKKHLEPARTGYFPGTGQSADSRHYPSADNRRSENHRGQSSRNGKTAEIDLDKKTWIIPWQCMKMGRRKINPDTTNHRIDLPRLAINLLNELQTITGNSRYLFPGQKDHSKHMSNNRAEFIKERKKMMQDWANHIDKLRTGKIILPKCA